MKLTIEQDEGVLKSFASGAEFYASESMLDAANVARAVRKALPDLDTIGFKSVGVDLIGRELHGTTAYPCRFPFIIRAIDLKINVITFYGGRTDDLMALFPNEHVKVRR